MPRVCRQGRLPRLAGLEQSHVLLWTMLTLGAEQPRSVPGTAWCPWRPRWKDTAFWQQMMDEMGCQGDVFPCLLLFLPHEVLLRHRDHGGTYTLRWRRVSNLWAGAGGRPRVQEPPLTEAEGWRGETQVLPLQASQHHFSLRSGCFGTPESSKAAPSPASSPRHTAAAHGTRNLPTASGPAAGEPGRGRWQQSLFLATAGMRQPGPRSDAIQPCRPPHQAGIYRPSSPLLYPQSEFSTTAPFPLVSLLKYDSQFRMDLNFSLVRMCQAN